MPYAAFVLPSLAILAVTSKRLKSSRLSIVECGCPDGRVAIRNKCVLLTVSTAVSVNEISSENPSWMIPDVLLKERLQYGFVTTLKHYTLSKLRGSPPIQWSALSGLCKLTKSVRLRNDKSRFPILP